EVWRRFEGALADVGADEIDWRPIPEANSINVIVRHLRIEGEWHLDSLRQGAPLPTVAAPVSQEAIDAVALDFTANFEALSGYQSQYLEYLRTSMLPELEERTSSAYGSAV